MFTILIFSTIAMQLFGGQLSKRCVPTLHRNDLNFTAESEHWLKNSRDEEIICGKVTCPTNSECLVRENPNYGMMSADNLLYAGLMVFEIITLEGWSDMMYTVRRANNGSFMFDFFFSLVVITGAFFVLNLMTAV